jgi:hypothetical protein
LRRVCLRLCSCSPCFFAPSGAFSLTLLFLRPNRMASRSARRAKTVIFKRAKLKKPSIPDPFSLLLTAQLHSCLTAR